MRAPRLTALCTLAWWLAVGGCTTFDDESVNDPGKDGPGAGVPSDVVSRSTVPGSGAPQSGCKDGKDCTSGICKGGVCTDPAPDDGIKNGDESDVDCGGAKAPKCAPDKHCASASDCDSAVCTSGTCVAPTPTDGVKNQGESDVDCGGPNAPKCEVGQACVEHSDCKSEGCSFEKKCVADKSCTAHFGGDTCGPGEVDEAGHRHESCCTTIAVDGGIRMDKYDITAGRMRAFIERFKGNIRQFGASLAGDPRWDQTWTPSLPSTMDEANIEMGPYGADADHNRQGCWLKGEGSRIYWQPDDVNIAYGDEIPQKYGKDILDTKALNCTTFWMFQSFCIWEGGRLPTITELDREWAGTYPWGNTPIDADHAVLNFNYGWPEDRLDNTAYIAAPGRKPAGYSPKGFADLGGLLFNMTSTFDASGNVRWSRNGSWEVHPLPYDVHYSPKTRAYEAAGARCVRL
jgi:hypothetical protein